MKNPRLLAQAVRKDLAQIVCCPVHKTRLELRDAVEDDRGDIRSAALRCAACRFDYPVEEGIPNLLPPEYHVDEVREGKAKDAPRAGPGKARKGAA